MMQRIALPVALLAVLTSVGYLLAGPLGLVTVIVASGGAAVLVARALAVPPVPAIRIHPAVELGPSGRFHRYEKLAEMLGWAPLAGRHYEYGARRVLRDLVTQWLAQRHHIDLAADPAGARAVLGERCWALVDPAVVYSSREPGVDLRRIEELVSLMEER
jgi:hypothetical protein